MEIWAPWETSRHAREFIGPRTNRQDPIPDDEPQVLTGTWIGPLTCLRVVRHSRLDMAALPHVWETIEAFLDCSPSCTLTQAAAFGSMRLLRGISARSGGMVTLDAFYKQAQFSGAMQHAAARGDLEMIQWLLTFQPGGLVTRAVEQAAKNGQLQVITWLKEHHDHVFWGANELRYAIEGDHADVARWLQENTRPPSKLRAMNLAAANGNLELVQWLHEVRHEASSSAAAKAAKGGFLDMLKWMDKHALCKHQGVPVIVFAKRYNYYLMDWLHRNYQASGERTVLAEINSSFYLTPPETEELTT
ncbi:Ankyrin repeat-containing domain [Phytophthora cactorum]|nr:Ankyrin repeat-containing domain [Phytophthora cactorum]